MSWAVVLYVLGGCVLSAVGGGVVAAALGADWFARGYKRRRCPKCWFDLSGTPGMTCPECGKTARRESRLFRTRRRWGFAVLGLAVVLGGVGIAGWPAWRTRDWFTLLPMALKVEFWDSAPDPELAFADMMKGAGGFSEARKRRVMDSAMRWMVGAPTRSTSASASGRSAAAVRARMVQIQYSGGVIRPDSVLTQPYGSWPLSDSGRDDLYKLVTDPTLGMQAAAVRALAWRKDLDERFKKSLCELAAVSDGRSPRELNVFADGGLRETALEVLGSFAEEQWAYKALEGVLARDLDSLILYTAACSLMNAAPLRPEMVAGTFKSVSAEGRQALMAAMLYRRSEIDASVLYPQVLDEAVSDDERASKTAFSVLSTEGAEVERLIVDKLGAVQGKALERLVALIETRRQRGPAGEPLMLALEAIGADPKRSEADRAAATAGAAKLRSWSEVGERLKGRSGRGGGGGRAVEQK